MATAEWESYALSSRFKTKRTKKRLAKEHHDKQLIHLYKELRQLQLKQRQLGYRELVPPVQKGWKRFFVLRPDLLVSKDAPFFLELLEKINTTEYSHRKDFKYKRRRKGKRVDVVRPQKLKEFHLDAFEKLKLTDREKTYFKLEWRFFSINRMLLMHVFTDPWRYVLRVRPNMITHQRIIDPQLVSREKEIHNYLDRNGLTARMNKVVHGFSWRSWHADEPKAKYAGVYAIDPYDEIENETTYFNESQHE